MIFVDVLIIILLFVLFSLPHSVLASLNFKKKMQERIGTKIAFYRIFYNLFALVSFYLFYIISPKPAVTIYDLDYPFDIAMIFFQVLSLLGLWWSLRPIDLKEFLGIDQIFRWLNNNYDVTDMDEKLTLRIEGPYKYVRHPIYFFSIIILAFRPQMDLFYLTAFVCICIYFYIGSLYEERKMIDRFGSQYLDYQNTVPRIFPISLSKLFNSKNAMEIK